MRRRDEDAAAIPDQLEVDASDDPQRKPVTDWELVIGDLDLDAADDSQLAGSNAEFVPFELSVHSLKTGKVLSAVEQPRPRNSTLPDWRIRPLVIRAVSV